MENLDSKKVRNKIYRRALEIHREDPCYGLCIRISETQKKLKIPRTQSYTLNVTLNYEEFSRFTPDVYNFVNCWWDFDERGNDIRETVLLFCIEMSK